MKHRTIVTGAIALSFAAGAAIAANDRYLPPPGLYEIQVVNTLTSRSPSGTTQTRDTFDEKGGVSSEYRREDGSRATHAVAGNAPNRTCIGPTKSGALPKDMAMDGCTASKGEVIGGEMVVVQSCPWGKMKIHMRQIDAKTWQTSMNMVKSNSGDGPGASEKTEMGGVRMTRIGNCKG